MEPGFLSPDALQEPTAEELAEQEETVARRCAKLLEVAREALEMDLRIVQRPRKKDDPPAN